MSTEEKHADDPFGSEPCSVLVFYAVDDPADEPDGATPSLVLEPRWSHLLTADRAPYLTELVDDQFIAELEQAERKAATQDERQVVDRIRDWYLRQKKPAVLYQLEPLSIAGKGTARRIGLEWERAGRS